MQLLGEILSFVVGFYLGSKYHHIRRTSKTK